MYKRYKKHCLAAIFCTAILTSQPVLADPVPLNLETAIQMALANNPKTVIADGNLQSALGAKKRVIGTFGPQVSFQHRETRGQNYQAINDDVASNFNNAATVSMPVYTGGRREGSVNASRRLVEVAEMEVGRTDQEVKLDATSAYYNVLQTRNMVELNKESVERLELHLKNVQAQYAVGTVAKADVLRSEVELADAQQELIKAENSYEISLANINNIIGLPLDTEILVNDNLSYLEYAKTLDNCLSFAGDNRPEIAQAVKRVSAAKSEIQAARAGYIPQININAAHGWDKDKFPGDEKASWSIGATVNFNIFDSNTTRGSVDAAQGTLTQREAQYRQTRDGVFLEVRSDYLSLREAEKRIYTASVTVEKAQEDYKIAQVRYQAGVGTNTDVLDAQVALTKAQTNYVQALYDYNTSWANLEKAMGVPVMPAPPSSAAIAQKAE